jgi:hypothetical protein
MADRSGNQEHHQDMEHRNYKAQKTVQGIKMSGTPWQPSTIIQEF